MNIEVDIFLNRLKISQLQKLIDRHELKMIHISNYRKRNDMEKTLSKYIKTNGIGECPICFEKNKCMIAVTTPCAHIFCDSCLITHLKKNHMCPMCREPVDLLFIMNQISVYRLLKLRHVLKGNHVIDPPEDLPEDARENPPENNIIEYRSPIDVIVEMSEFPYTGYIYSSFFTIYVYINIFLILIVICHIL